EAYGIPLVFATGKGYFDTNEVRDILNYLRIIDNPLSDIHLFGVLRSVFGNFNEDEIGQIRGADKSVSLYENLVNFTGDVDLTHKISSFLARLEGYREMVTYKGVRDVILKIINDHSYLDVVSAMPCGARRKANVLMLLTKAASFEKTGSFGVFKFVRYVEAIDKYDIDDGEPDILDEANDVVRVMTIHKSKGLEFPITIVADMGKQFNMANTKGNILMDSELGMGVKYFDVNRRFRKENLRYLGISKKIRYEEMAENLRVLYVALTRAREKLIMVAESKDAQKLCERIAGAEDSKCSYLKFVNAGSFLELMEPVLSKHVINVQFVTPKELALVENDNEMEENLLKAEISQDKITTDTELAKAIKTRINKPYPHKNTLNLYAKTTVTELKMAAMADEGEWVSHSFETNKEDEYVPTFAEEKRKISGTVRGNAYHRFMEIARFGEIYKDIFTEYPGDFDEFSKNLDEDILFKNISQEAFAMKENKKLDEESYEAVDVRKLSKFFMSNLAYRMWGADLQNKLKREQPFVLGLSADRVNREFPPEETVLIQGIIDAFFEEDQRTVLMDYKTDVVDNEEILIKRYKTQLEYYKEALERLFKNKVREGILYSFYLGREVRVEL
nr:PD-(D/E)XK nuclease family protein [Lachnospiraceae bacterium]